ncbi:hypothetical protein RvY_00558 [Ramazzottius varieornatus]|uniref:Uncharacterized protein n=1 Tax=Ramazzottius varieornatus TaxID=947166 RepID=A0A1D1UDN3_RAMVA|nr:hypothetical protein RvY_00558 [Ramazzottius varieornatus]
MVQFFEERERLSGRRRTYFALRTENMVTEPYYVRHTLELAEMADDLQHDGRLAVFEAIDQNRWINPGWPEKTSNIMRVLFTDAVDDMTIAGLLWTELVGQSVDRELIKRTTTADIVDCTSSSGKAL